MATRAGFFPRSIASPPGTRRAFPSRSCRTIIPIPRRKAFCAACTSRRRRSRRTSWCASCAAPSSTSRSTFGRHVAVELSAENWRQLLIPIGFAHAFITLEPDVEVLYKTTAPYSAAHDRGIAWDDPAIGIAWPSPPGGPVLSDKDRKWPRLKDAPDLFE